MDSLPPTPQTNIGDHEPDIISAYDIVLGFERNAETDRDALHARILGYLILYSPSIDARNEMARVIHSCDQKHDALSELGQQFFDGFIRPFTKFRGRIPDVYYFGDPLSNEERMDLSVITQEAPEGLKSQALKRDGYRCVFTGTYDCRAIDIVEEYVSRAVHTRCTHIVPDLTYVDLSTPENPPEKKFSSSPVLAILECFGYDVENLKGPKMHSLFNVMTMDINTCHLFDRLEIWLEATEVRDCYRIEVVNKYKGLTKLPEKITLTSSDPVNLPVPSPELLALHATCAKVTQSSGADAYIDGLDEDVDESCVLVRNGESVDVVAHTFMRPVPITHWHVGP